MLEPRIPGAESRAKLLRQVVFSLDDLRAYATTSGADPDLAYLAEDDEPFLVVFQHGKSVWAGLPESVQGLVVYSVNTTIVGDIAIAVWFSDRYGLRHLTTSSLSTC